VLMLWGGEGQLVLMLWGGGATRADAVGGEGQLVLMLWVCGWGGGWHHNVQVPLDGEVETGESHVRGGCTICIPF